MENSINSTSPRLHPLVVAAAASVTVVSLLGAAAIAGIFPSHSHAMNSSVAATLPAQTVSTVNPIATQQQTPPTALIQAVPTRFQTADGRQFEEVTSHASPRTVNRVTPINAVEVQRPVHHVAHHKVAHHYTQKNTAYQPGYVQDQPYYDPHPVRSYVNDMNPVGTGMGAVVGGLLGNQVGGGNGKKLATVAGVLLGVTLAMKSRMTAIRYLSAIVKISINRLGS